MSSSSAIKYPTLKGLEQSNPSFVQVPQQPVRETNRNLLLNHRNVSKSERGSKSRSKQKEFAERKEERFIERCNQREYLSNFERRAVSVRDIGDPDTRAEKSNPPDVSNGHLKHKLKIEKIKGRTVTDKDVGDPDTQIEYSNPRDMANGHLKPKLKIEEVDQLDVGELGLSDEFIELEKASKNYEESTELSLTKSEPFQSLIGKHPKHTIIINNTFINRSGQEQEGFLTKFSPTFYTKTANIGLVTDILPSVSEHSCNDDFQTFIESRHDGFFDQNKHAEFDAKAATDIENSAYANEPNNDSISLDKNVPLASIITAILWIVLILFWFLMYLKVLNVYNPLPKVMPKPEPTNYELCLRIFRKLGIIVGQILKF